MHPTYAPFPETIVNPREPHLFCSSLNPWIRAGLIGYYPSTLFLQLNDYEIRKGKKIGVTISYNNHRLFVGYIPKNRDRDDLFEEFSKHARKLKSTTPSLMKKLPSVA